MTQKLRPLAALAMVALIGAGCSNAPAETGTGTGGNTSATDRDKAVKFAECMRDNGVSEFPDPDASGELTIDGVVNGSSLDTSSRGVEAGHRRVQGPAAIGVHGPQERAPRSRSARLEFAQCIRDNGVKDFPDPADGEPLVDTNRIPSAEPERWHEHSQRRDAEVRRSRRQTQLGGR